MDTQSKTPFPALRKQSIFRERITFTFFKVASMTLMSERVGAIGTAVWTADFLVLRYGKLMWLLRAMLNFNLSTSSKESPSLLVRRVSTLR